MWIQAVAHARIDQRLLRQLWVSWAGIYRYTGYTLTIQAQETSCGPVTPGLWGCGHRTAP